MQTAKGQRRAVQRRFEAGRGDRLLGRDRQAADPQSLQSRRPRVLGHADEEGAKDSLAAMLVDCRAVPDVALITAGLDLHLELSDPLRARGKPAVAGDCTVDPNRKASATPSKSRPDQVDLG